MEKKVLRFPENAEKMSVFALFYCRFLHFGPAEPYFRAGRPIKTNIPLYYLTHENPYQHSCWGKSSTFDESPCRFFKREMQHVRKPLRFFHQNR